MFESKYSKVLTVILVIVIVAIVGLLGFLAYDYYQNYMTTKETSDFVDGFEEEISNETPTNNTAVDNNTTGENPFEAIEATNTASSSSTNKRETYKGYGVFGTMKIPAINFRYPILDTLSTSSLETSVVFLYGVGLNKPGNSVIIGHNYRNGVFFSNNKKLNIGDKIFITDEEGKTLTYNIYSKFEATPEDTSFYQRDTGGLPEVTLSTCTDDSSARLIICAKAE